jgi:hypothetical protein
LGNIVVRVMEGMVEIGLGKSTLRRFGADEVGMQASAHDQTDSLLAKMKRKTKKQEQESEVWKAGG